MRPDAADVPQKSSVDTRVATARALAGARAVALTPNSLLVLQRTAGNVAVKRSIAGQPPANMLMRHPAGPVVRRAIRWIAGRTINTVSRHVARHARNIAGRAVHSVFRTPRHIRYLIERTLQEAWQVVERRAATEAEDLVEQGAIRIQRQTTGTPGKIRWRIERTFREPIGTRGERVLRVILDQSGRVVTAFPAERLAAVALTAGGITVLEESTAEAAQAVADDTRTRARRDEERESQVHWEEFIPFVGDIFGGELNAGEDEMLAQMRFVDSVVHDIILRIEHEEQRSIGGERRRALAELILVGIAAPMALEGAFDQ